MADDMTAIVQRMIDAGESEENIASVIQHYKSAYTPDPSMQAETQRAIASQTSYVPPRKVTDELGNEVGGMAEGPAKNFVRNVVQNPLTQATAYPESVGDLLNLIAPADLAPGARAAYNTLKNARQSLSAPAEAFLMNKLGLDPEAMNLRATKMRLQAAKARTRVMEATRAASPPQPASLPPGVEPYAPNVSGGLSAGYGQSASDVQGSLAEPHAPNVSTAVPTQAPPAHWAEHLAANPDAWRVDPYMPNVSAGKVEYAPPTTPVSGHLQVDPHMPNVSTLTPEQLAAQAAVHNAPVAAEAPIPVSGPQGVPPGAQVPSSFAALLRPPSPAQLANAEGLVARGRSLADAARTVSRGDAELGARIMSALQQSQK